ncbi:MAG: GNAT family N-acetyltransferase [Proteobacteria bacterium]|nr:GNAT family N-acetyltransferase [Pseudomonadota bacterium]
MARIAIRPAVAADVPLILDLIRALGEYERLAHEVIATESDLHAQLFGAKPAAEVLIGELDGAPAGFALYFHNFSTFLGKPGIYLEDVFVRPEHRGAGLGKALMVELARIAVERGCGRFEWSVLDWNQPSIDFYRSLGAVGMDEWTVQRVSGEALRNLAETEAK